MSFFALAVRRHISSAKSPAVGTARSAKQSCFSGSDRVFERTTYTLRNNFDFDTPYAADEFARQITRIDWPQTRIPLLPDQFVNYVFKLTNFETCLRHGRFEAAISIAGSLVGSPTIKGVLGCKPKLGKCGVSCTLSCQALLMANCIRLKC